MEKSLKKQFLLFLGPTAVAFAIAFVLPFLLGVFLSFTEFTTVTDAKWVGFSNYLRALTANDDFWKALWFTVKFTAVSVVTVNVLAFALAGILTTGVPGQNLFRTVFFVPNLIGGIVLGYLWQVIFNGILLFFHTDLTAQAAYGFWGLVILMNWQTIGYMMVIYIAGIQNIPPELMEAAAIDGAGKWAILRHITLPSVMPSIAICTFLTLSNSFKLFDQNFALTGGAPGRETSMLALDIYQTFYGRVGWEGIGQAKAVIFSAIVALLAVIQLRLTRSQEQ